MGNSMKDNSTNYVKYGLGVFGLVLMISGFVIFIYSIFFKDNTKINKNTIADEDRQCISQNTGKVKNNI